MKRYQPVIIPNAFSDLRDQAVCVESSDGEYVKYEDALREIKKLNDRIDMALQLLEEVKSI